MDDHSGFGFFRRTVLAGLVARRLYLSLGEVYCGIYSGLSLYWFGILQVIGSQHPAGSAAEETLLGFGLCLAIKAPDY